MPRVITILGRQVYCLRAISALVLSSVCVRDRVSVQHFEDLLVIGCPVRDSDDSSVYRIKHIMGKHSKSGKWGMYPRCGSVITCVINVRSLYAIVFQFVKLDRGDRCLGMLLCVGLVISVCELFVSSCKFKWCGYREVGRFESDTNHTD